MRAALRCRNVFAPGREERTDVHMARPVWFLFFFHFLLFVLDFENKVREKTSGEMATYSTERMN